MYTRSKIVLDVDRDLNMAFVMSYQELTDNRINKLGLAIYWNVTGIKKEGEKRGYKKRYAILSNGKQIGTVDNIDEIVETW